MDTLIILILLDHGRGWRKGTGRPTPFPPVDRTAGQSGSLQAPVHSGHWWSFLSLAPRSMIVLGPGHPEVSRVREEGQGLRPNLRRTLYIPATRPCTP